MPELDGAVVVTEVLLALGVRGHQPVITHANGPRLFRLGSAILAEFGLADHVGAAPGDGDDQALGAERGDGLAGGAARDAELLL